MIFVRRLNDFLGHLASAGPEGNLRMIGSERQPMQEQ